jgi:hypothetical protein
MLMDAHDAGQLKFINTHAGPANKHPFKCFIGPLRRIKWAVYCKPAFAAAKQVRRPSLLRRYASYTPSAIPSPTCYASCECKVLK